MEREMGWRIGAAGAIVVMKRELCQEAKLSIYQSIFVPLTYGHRGRVMTERPILWIQVAKMGFLRRAGISLR